VFGGFPYEEKESVSGVFQFFARLEGW
jgi:hypothetical protein